MKSNVTRSLLIFAAGAATAALAGGLYPTEPITPGQFDERATVLIAEVEALGGYVGTFADGRVGIYTDPAACYPPVPPKPVMPKGVVDSRSLQNGLNALAAANAGRAHGETFPVYVIGKCKPYAQGKN
jgi:hypothetical protein